MALDFPSPATTGQTYSGPNNTVWSYDGAKWIPAASVPVWSNDAPSDSFLYDRQNGAWTRDPIQADAPSDTFLYERRSAGWVRDPIQADAPDSSFYVRQNGAWTLLPAATAINDNRIINGNFAVNQRAQVSGTALAAAAYGHDRWKAGASGCTYTFTAALPDTTVTITAGTLTQIIEAGVIEGGVYTLSWTGTAQARVYQGTPTGVYAASPLVTTSLPAGVNTIVEFNTGTVVRVKFETGTTATPYNRQSLAKSTADCQRYFQTGKLYGAAYASAAAQAFNTSVSCPVVMRAVPTLVRTASGNVNISGTPYLGMDALSDNNFYANGATTAAGATAININFTANAEL